MKLLAGSGKFYADPVTMAFVQWDGEFERSRENARRYIDDLGWWRNDADVCWRIQGPDDPPLVHLTEGSAGGAFVASLWHLLSNIHNDLSVTISAAINDDGSIAPVKYIQEKIRAILEVPELSELVVAEGQSEITTGQCGRLQIRKATHIADPKRHGRHLEGNR